MREREGHYDSIDGGTDVPHANSLVRNQGECIRSGVQNLLGFGVVAGVVLLGMTKSFLLDSRCHCRAH